MPYPELLLRPMREELTRLGVEELRTADDVDETLAGAGHHAGGGELGLRLRGAQRPPRGGAGARATTPGRTAPPPSSPGQDVEATAQAREPLPRLPALLALHRADEGRGARLHDGAPPDRGPRRGRDRGRPHRRLRPLLRHARLTRRSGSRRPGRACLSPRPALYCDDRRVRARLPRPAAPPTAPASAEPEPRMATQTRVRTQSPRPRSGPSSSTRSRSSSSTRSTTAAPRTPCAYKRGRGVGAALARGGGARASAGWPPGWRRWGWGAATASPCSRRTGPSGPSATSRRSASAPWTCPSTPPCPPTRWPTSSTTAGRRRSSSPPPSSWRRSLEIRAASPRARSTSSASTTAAAREGVLALRRAPASGAARRSRRAGRARFRERAPPGAARRPRHPHLHLRHHRQPEGRHAHPPQPGLQRGGRGAAPRLPARAGRRRPLLPAALARLRAAGGLLLLELRGLRSPTPSRWTAWRRTSWR